MSSPIFQQRLRDLEENIAKTQKLLREYERKRDLSNDPREKEICKVTIEELKEAVRGYHNEFRELEQHKNQELPGDKDVSKWLSSVKASLSELDSGNQSPASGNQSPAIVIGAVITSIATIIAAWIGLNGVIPPLDGNNRELPTTEEFQNLLTLCAAGSGFTVDGELRGAIGQIYSDERDVQIDAREIIIETAPIFLESLPQEDQLAAFEIYQKCILGILGSSGTVDAETSSGSSPRSVFSLIEPRGGIWPEQDQTITLVANPPAAIEGASCNWQANPPETVQLSVSPENSCQAAKVTAQEIPDESSNSSESVNITVRISKEDQIIGMAGTSVLVYKSLPSVPTSMGNPQEDIEAQRDRLYEGYPLTRHLNMSPLGLIFEVTFGPSDPPSERPRFLVNGQDVSSYLYSESSSSIGGLSSIMYKLEGDPTQLNLSPGKNQLTVQYGDTGVSPLEFNITEAQVNESFSAYETRRRLFGN